MIIIMIPHNDDAIAMTVMTMVMTAMFVHLMVTILMKTNLSKAMVRKTRT